jgi:hypothetical protein
MTIPTAAPQTATIEDRMIVSPNSWWRVIPMASSAGFSCASSYEYRASACPKINSPANAVIAANNQSATDRRCVERFTNVISSPWENTRAPGEMWLTASEKAGKSARPCFRSPPNTGSVNVVEVYRW